MTGQLRAITHVQEPINLQGAHWITNHSTAGRPSAIWPTLCFDRHV